MNIHIPVLEINKNNVDIRFSGATKSMSRDRVSEIGKCCNIPNGMVRKYHKA